MPTARQPRDFASWPTALPTAPLAALTTTVCPAFGCQGPGVHALVVVGAGGKGHQDRPPARGLQLGAGAGPGAAQDEAGGFHGLIHARDEGHQAVARVAGSRLQPLEFGGPGLMEATNRGALWWTAPSSHS